MREEINAYLEMMTESQIDITKGKSYKINVYSSKYNKNIEKTVKISKVIKKPQGKMSVMFDIDGKSVTLDSNVFKSKIVNEAKTTQTTKNDIKNDFGELVSDVMPESKVKGVKITDMRGSGPTHIEIIRKENDTDDITYRDIFKKVMKTGKYIELGKLVGEPINEDMEMNEAKKTVYITKAGPDWTITRTDTDRRIGSEKSKELAIKAAEKNGFEVENIIEAGPKPGMKVNKKGMTIRNQVDFKHWIVRSFSITGKDKKDPDELKAMDEIMQANGWKGITQLLNKSHWGKSEMAELQDAWIKMNM